MILVYSSTQHRTLTDVDSREHSQEGHKVERTALQSVRSKQKYVCRTREPITTTAHLLQTAVLSTSQDTH